MKVVIAIDSLKGSLSSIEAGNAAADGVRAAMPDAMVVVKPLADGGEGTTDALIEGMLHLPHLRHIICQFQQFFSRLSSGQNHFQMLRSV